MRTLKCIVCKKRIKIFGWPNHVKMHKRKLGENVYDFYRGKTERANPEQAVLGEYINEN